MMKWNYDASSYDSNKYALIEEGKHRVRIKGAYPVSAKNGTDGLEIVLDVYGCDKKLKYYIWFNHDAPALTNQTLGEFYDSFSIPSCYHQEFLHWHGKLGAVYVVHDSYKGRVIARVACCIPGNRQDGLPLNFEPVDSNIKESNAIENITNKQSKTENQVQFRGFNGFSF